MKKPGARVLYLGAASGTTVSHVSDIVGPVSCFSVVFLHILEFTYFANQVPFLLVGRKVLFMRLNSLTEVVEIW